jgi:radical SAM superfamily enzyme YgiQ (UPF0313 family)
VLLVLPPKGFSSKEPLPSLGLIYIAAMLETEGFPVKVLDAAVERLSWRELRRRLVQESPDIVGITCLTEYRMEAFRTAKIARDVLGPDTHIVMGGPHVSLTANDTLRHQPAITAVVRGEGEYTFLELCHVLWEGKALETIPGISYRKNSDIIHNKPAPPPANLDALPFPARHLLNMRKYKFALEVPGRGKLQAAHIITSRGCPFGCSFCATSQISGRRWRYRSPENILAELEHLQLRQPELKAVWFYDDTFTMNKLRVERICDLILEKRIDLPFTCSIRVDTVTFSLLKKMNDAGCFKVFSGVESASPRILNEVCMKGISLDQVRNVSAWLDDLDIQKNPGYIIGFPDESIEDARQTLEVMKSVGGIASLSLLRIYPGTKIEQIAREKGVLPKDFSWANENQSAPEQFRAAHGNAPIFVDTLSWNDLSELTLQWVNYQGISVWNRFPGVLRNIRSWQDMKHTWTMGWKFIQRILSFLHRLPSSHNF